MTARRRIVARLARRAAVVAAVVAALLAVGGGGWWWRDRAELSRLLAATAAGDPHWTLADLTAGRSLPTALAAFASRSQPLTLTTSERVTLEALDLGDRLDPAQRALLAAALTPDRVAALRTLDDSDSQTPLTTGAWTADPPAALLGTLVALRPLREAVELLGYEQLLRTDLGDRDAAVRAWLTQWAVARSAAAVPGRDAALVRIDGQRQVCRSLERLLARRTWADYQLAAIQAELQAECDADRVVEVIRGERAYVDAVYLAVAAETVSRAALPKPVGAAGGVAGRVGPWLPGGVIRDRRDRRDHLERFNAASALARLPEPARFDALEAFPRDLPPRPATTRWATTRVVRAVAAERHAAALARCTLAAVACERYRGRTGRFPATLDEVVAAGLLSAVPRDPFANTPLRLAHGGRLVVYSVGPNGRDDGGTLWTYRDHDLGADWGVTLLPPVQRGLNVAERQ